LSEKEKIEKAIADAFIELYNADYDTTYVIKEYSDAPDIRCQDGKGNIFNLEITLTEDRPSDIPALLGRSDHKNLETLKSHLDKVKTGSASIFDSVSCLSGNVLETLIQRILAKSNKDYGNNVALVVRDSSPVGWDWENIIPDIRHGLKGHNLPFDKGVWLISYDKNRIVRLV